MQGFVRDRQEQEEPKGVLTVAYAGYRRKEMDQMQSQRGEVNANDRSYKDYKRTVCNT
jgi:hypothetical protein